MLLKTPSDLTTSASFNHPVDLGLTARARGMRRVRRSSGAALIETMIAVGITAIFLSGIHLMNAQVWSQVRASLESTAAMRDLTGRTEQVRASTWTQVTDPTYLNGTIFAVAPDAAGDLGNVVETIDITAHLAPSGTVAPIKVQRMANGTTTTVNAGDGTMAQQTSVRFDITVNWTAKNGRAHTRQVTLIAGAGGILGRS